MDEAVNTLSTLNPGRLPLEVFHEIARLVVTPTVVLVPWLVESECLSVLLTRRSREDRYYPSMLHPPGTVLLPTDASIEGALERLISTELNGVTFAGESPKFVDFFFEKIMRGQELSLIFALQIARRTNSSMLYPISELPSDLIPTDRHRIERVGRKLVESGTVKLP